jgi:hypothetical protein
MQPAAIVDATQSRNRGNAEFDGDEDAIHGRSRAPSRVRHGRRRSFPPAAFIRCRSYEVGKGREGVGGARAE